jgi:hypothetical protein
LCSCFESAGAPPRGRVPDLTKRQIDTGV